jgi:AraC-like DNA-binding protein
VTEICFRVGYEDFSNFTRAFRKAFNQTPSQYRSTMRTQRGPLTRHTGGEIGRPEDL